MTVLDQDRLEAYQEFVVKMTAALEARSKTRLEALLSASKDKLPPTEDYAVVRAALVNTLLESFRTYVSASRGRASGIAARRALIEGISSAFYSGYRQAGGEETEPDDEKWLTETQRAQLGWMDNTFDALKVERDTEAATVPALQARAEAWGTTLDGIHSEGVLRGKLNIMLTFDGDDGEESCTDCQKYKGQRHSARWWLKRDLVRRSGNHNYECGRWSNCHHHFYSDSGEIYAE